MGKKLSEDEIKFILSVDATKAQQEVHKLTKANRELSRSNKERARKLQELEMLGRKGLPVYQNLKRAYDQTASAIEHNNQKIEKYKKQIGYVNMSYAQLKKESSKLRTQLDNTSRSLHQKEWQELNSRLQEVRERMAEVSSGARTVGGSLRASLHDAVRYQLSIQAAVAALFMLVRNVKSFIDEGARLAGVAQGIDAAFRKIADNNYLASLREETKGLLDDNLLKKYTVQAKNLGIPIEHMGKLLAFAQQRAKDTGESVDYMASSIVTGLGRKSVMILDNLGLSAAQINEELKKTGSFSGAVMKILDEEMSKLGESINTAEESAVRSSVRWQNLQLQVGGYFINIRESISRASGNFADFFSSLIGWIDKHYKTIVVSIKAIVASYTAYIAVVHRAIVAEKLHVFWMGASRKAVLLTRAAFSLLTGQITKARAAMRLLNLSAKANPVGLLAAAISAAVTVFVAFISKSEKLGAVQKSLGNVSRKASQGFAEEAAKIDVLTKTVENNNLSLKDRRSAIEGLRSIMPDYNATIDEEGRLINHNTKAIQVYLAQLEKQIKLKAAQEELENIYRKKRLAEKKLKELNKYDPDQGAWQRESERSERLQTRNELIELRQVEYALRKEIESTSIAESNASKKEKESKNSLIATQKELLKAAETLPETTEKEIALKNKKIQAINREINRLEALGKSKEKTQKKDSDRISLIRKTAEEEKAIFDESQKRIRLQAKAQMAAGKISAEHYAVVVAATEKASADNRLRLMRDLHAQLVSIEYKGGAEKKKALQETASSILIAEEEVLNARVALNSTMADVVASVWEKMEKAKKDAAEKARKEQEALNAPNEMMQQFGLVDAEFELQMKLSALDEYYKSALEKYKDNEEVKTQLAGVYAAARAKIEQESLQKNQEVLAELGIVGRMMSFLQESELINQQYKEQLIDAEQFEKMKADIRKRAFEDVSGSILSVSRQVSKYMQQEELTAIDQKYQAEMAAAQGNQEQLQAIEEKKEAEKLKIQKKYADIDFAIKAAEIVSNTAVAVTKALAVLGPIAGPIAAAVVSASGLAQLAIANQEREKVKAMQVGSRAKSYGGNAMRVASGRESGGWIDVEREQDGKRFRASLEPGKRGYVDRPTVIVGEGAVGSSLEWVASNDALKNPTVAPIISLLDAAQLNGQIRTIDMNAILRSRMSGFESGGAIAPQSSAYSIANYTPQADSINSVRSIKAMEAFVAMMEKTSQTGLSATIVLSDLQRKQALMEQSRKFAKK